MVGVEYANIEELIPYFKSHFKIVLVGAVTEADSVQINISDTVWCGINVEYVITVKPSSSATAMDALGKAISENLKVSIQNSLSSIPGAGDLVSDETSVTFDVPRVSESVTQMRYSVFSERLLGVAVAQRDFILAARATQGSLQRGHGLDEECLVISMTSVKQDSLNEDDWSPHLLQPDSRMKHGRVHAIGIVATALEGGTGDAGGGITKVEILVDLHPCVPDPNLLIDFAVRSHVLKTAERLRAVLED